MSNKDLILEQDTTYHGDLKVEGSLTVLGHLHVFGSVTTYEVIEIPKHVYKDLSFFQRLKYLLYPDSIKKLKP